METYFEGLKASQARLEVERTRRRLDEFRPRYRDWAAGKLTLSALCEEAGKALDGYAVETLDSLASVAAVLQPSDAVTTWMLQRYGEAISGIGAALRDEVLDLPARHRVTQTLQTRLLLAESRISVLAALHDETEEPRAGD
jgi:hypothetical protein